MRAPIQSFAVYYLRLMRSFEQAACLSHST
jgi:hypothetical protein